jgi:hypothetical protein
MAETELCFHLLRERRRPPRELRNETLLCILAEHDLVGGATNLSVASGH